MQKQCETEDIAIIGASLRFPGATTLDEFWDNLAQGRSFIGEVPQRRWDAASFQGDPRREKNKTNCVRGGFLEDVDAFDASFFNISPREAQLMDPQQRIAMELAWRALEDAGYCGPALANSKTGVYLAMTNTDYSELIERDLEMVDAYVNTGTSNAILSNRISYWFDFRGPSVTVDAACAGSLVAVHQALQALRNGDCVTALAGGVNLCWSPRRFIALSQSGALSKEGECKAFDDDADGYVRGEGGGIILLKPLAAAVEAGDRIYAVVRGSGTNHGGRTNSLTVTNPRAHAELIRDLYQRERVDPATVSYIEAHGVGTPLGDSMEVRGLKSAFSQLSASLGEEPRKQYCGLGSVKSNIGHTEAAAGIAGILKVLGCLREKLLPPTLHFRNLNTLIDLSESPFYIVDTLRPWPAAAHAAPRRAGVSAFGFGGGNAHVLLEEYLPREAATDGLQAERGPYLVPLSAVSLERLQEFARLLAGYLGNVWGKGEAAAPLLANIAYTLQVGRAALEERVLFLVREPGELVAAVEAFARGAEGIDHCFRGRAKGEPKGSADLAAQAFGPIAAPASEKELERMAELWVSGHAVDWQLLHEGARPRRTALPHYPLARQRYWMPLAAKEERAEAVAPVHPLLQIDLSDAAGRRFESLFDGSEFFLADHRVKGQRLLPGVAFLEMARATLQPPAGETGSELLLRNVVWLRPLVLEDGPVRVRISVLPGANGENTVELASVSVGGEALLHAKLKGELVPRSATRTLDLPALRRRCPKSVGAETCYARFEQAGFGYGPGHRAIDQVFLGDGELLALLSVPASVAPGRERFVLHPSVADGALQAALGLFSGFEGLTAAIPFTIRSARISAGSPTPAWCLVRYAQGSGPGEKLLKCDIELCDELGVICLSLEGVTYGKMEQEAAIIAEEVVSLQVRPATLPAGSSTKGEGAMNAELLRKKIEGALTAMVSEILKVDAAELDAETELNDYGFGSIAFTEFAEMLNDRHGLDLDPTIFFEYSTLRALAGHLALEFPGPLGAQLGVARSEDPTPVQPVADTGACCAQEKAEGLLEAACGAAAEGSPVKRQEDTGRQSGPGGAQEPVAVVGMSGAFPMAADTEQFWQNIVEGRDCIGEIPASRWDWREIYGDPATEGNRTDIKWGGFMEGADEFDPLFFGISPREALAMDPQQRLLMTHAWKAIEDAGYAPRSLSGSRTGIFVGTMNSGYPAMFARAGGALEGFTATSMMPSVGPNRMSYFLNLSGPSEPIETACSSSLVALHRAVAAIGSGACDMAISGGVNVIVSPEFHVSISKAGMLSPDGRCRTFSDQANGFVRGEGVGMLFLKKLSAAQEDGDRIYGVIRASAVNHGGRATSLTAPNPRAQAELLVTAYTKAEMDPRTVTYIEAHGTGTELGDPIEINGLKAAFRELYQATGEGGCESPHCALGSVKTNIGHLEIAAGIAGVFKVLLQLRHGTLAGSLHCEKVNPYIHLNDTPFYLIPRTREWQRLVDRTGAVLPRRAGVSSFGMGGVNAHVVIEELLLPQRPPYALNGEPALVLLSARNKERLRDMAHRLQEALGTGRFTDRDLPDIAYTLQVGRDAMEERLALSAFTLEEVRDKLSAYLEGREATDLYQGRASRNREPLGADDDDTEAQAHSWLLKRNWAQVLEFWVKGFTVEWGLLYGQGKPSRVSLPSYPFAREKFWIPEQGKKMAAQAASLAATPLSAGDATGTGELNRNSGDGRTASQQSSLEADAGDPVTCAVERLSALIAEVTHIEAHCLDPEAHFEELGLDSMMIGMLNQRIERWVGKLDSTLFFKYNGIRPLALHLVATYPQAIFTPAGSLCTDSDRPLAGPLLHAVKTELSGPDLFPAQAQGAADIAVIGMAGRYPQAETMGEFWKNLYEARDCIEEIPPQRWGLEGFFEPDRNRAVEQGLSYSKWGGFLKDVDCFDPLFFNISPRDAVYMDPQERLFLETAWQCLEDAGYTRASLGRDGYGNRIGVFAGASFNNYQLFMSEAAQRAQRPFYPANSQTFSIANRVSYHLNFTGPSMTVDTACSSSLTAIHLACESIRSGASALAIAGGVNLNIHPSKYITLAQGQFSANDGRCRAFAEGGTGYVPAEGVGAVLLKPVADAVRDGDRIYGVIKGTAASHGGKTSGYTVPNPVAQSLAIEAALRQGGIDARSVSCIEAHGTGTALGDPIEITGLVDVFRKQTPDTGFCSISSVKSNIGHAEAAAGIAQLTKVLLQLKHRTLVSNVMHGNRLNPNIDFGETPFVVQETNCPWVRPVIGEVTYPLRAGISSFGAGGANAHVVLEEFAPEREPAAVAACANPCVVPLSAKNADRLIESARRLARDIESGELAEVPLADLAYTLQVGREAMEERLALVAESVQDLGAKLGVFLRDEACPGCFRGRAAGRRPNSQGEGTDTGPLLEGDAVRLGQAWVGGGSVDWRRFYGATLPRRISLPTYPFARERCWVQETEPQQTVRVASATRGSQLHPLLHGNTSNFQQQRFSSTFSGAERFLSDHVVQGCSILPAVAYLEMARAAVRETVAGTGQISLRNVVWVRPVLAGEAPVTVHVGLYPEEDGEIAFEIYGEPETEAGEPVVHSQGRAVFTPAAAAPSVDLESLRRECGAAYDGSRCYDAYRAMGIDYGPAHRAIESLQAGERVVLANLALPKAALYPLDGLELHPSLMDGAFQAVLGLMAAGRGGAFPERPALPFALRELEIFGPCNSAACAVIRYGEGSRPGDKVEQFDIDLCDLGGEVRVRMKGLSARVLEGDDVVGRTASAATMLLRPEWRDEPIGAGVSVEYEQRLVVLVEAGGISPEELEALVPGARCLAFEAGAAGIAERYAECAAKLCSEIRGLLLARPAGSVLVQVVVPTDGKRAVFSGLAGLLKTARLENPKLVGQLIEVEPGEDASSIAAKLLDNGRTPVEVQVGYRNGSRRVRGWSEVADVQTPAPLPWRDQGVYMITGGAGGLGRIFAAEIVQRTKGATVVLLGRSAPDDDLREVLAQTGSDGARIVYRQADLTRRDEVLEAVSWILGEFGSLNGVLHAAGTLRDGFIVKKTDDDFRAVLAPKVAGTLYLDDATGDLPLDFFVLFSSLSGSFGNPGQADYATANAFLDAFAGYRVQEVGQGRRHGKTVSISWPLWSDGGMQVDAETRNNLRERTGLVPLETEAGLALFSRAVVQGGALAVMAGDCRRARALFLAEPSAFQAVPASAARQDAGDVPLDLLRDKGVRYLTKLVGSVIQLSADRIDADAPLERYGIDSVSVMRLTNELEKDFGSLSKTLFFEYQNLSELVGYFLQEHRSRLAELVGLEQPAGLPAAATPVTVRQDSGFAPPQLLSRRGPRFAVAAGAAADAPLDIAIVGVSGRYPGARNLTEFWNNLRDGVDSITEIPDGRWDHSRYFHPDKGRDGTTYSKWGGFIDGFDEFDPFFFNISPREAEIMDPQERIFLQCVYETLEDAGHTRDSLARDRTGLAGDVGVFVGVMYEEYQLYAAQETIQGRPMSFWGSPASIANRTSYFCNFRGPSMGVDTMCSSSLTAIHLACRAIQRGECAAAVAGGVNLSVHPNKYLFLAQGKFASSKGRCESFGEGGDGYVPGEGVGAVLLKPLSRAVADGDRIYGVIKGLAVNHGGKTNGYTVPNPVAQGEVIGRALREAGIDPRTISYLEAHGTGTSLGDPIEINGLNRSFREHTADRQFCAIGSVKSNIGHCESAAGVAGLTKVLLQFRHRQLVPSLHSEILNPNIDFTATPFVVQQELAEWKRPVVDGREIPRRAGVSSFGAGGSNAHMLLEEYIPSRQEQPSDAVLSISAVIVLSAKSADQLLEQAQRLLSALEGGDFQESDLAGMAYTLQVGRDAMDERLALVAGSLGELKDLLKAVVEGRGGIENVYRGQVKSNREIPALFAADEELQEAFGKWIQRGKYAKILELWVKGVNFDWNRLYGDIKPCRMSLPTYPFARERYWVPESPLGVGAGEPFATAALLHPLLHHNTSDLQEQRYSSTFTGAEFFLSDHVVQGRRILPAVAYLEMASEAVNRAVAGASGEGRSGIRLKNVVWTRPAVAGDQPLQLHVALFPEDNGEISYEIYGEPDGAAAEPVVFSQGSALLAPSSEVAHLDLDALRAACRLDTLDAGQLYRSFAALGIDYGPAHRGVETVYVGSGQLLAKLALPDSIISGNERFTLHPSLLDAALQAALGLWSGSDGITPKPALPFALHELEVIDTCSSSVWVHVRYSNGSTADDKVRKLDFDLCDENGKVCVRLKGCSFRSLEGDSDEAAMGMLMHRPVWREESIAPDAPVPDYTRRVVMICGSGSAIPEMIESRMQGVRLVVVPSEKGGVAERFEDHALRLFEELQALLKDRSALKVLFQVVTFAGAEGELFSGLSGLLKTARLENPKLIGQLIEMASEETPEGIVEKLTENGRSPEDSQIRYQGGRRHVAGWREVESSRPAATIPWKDNGVYLITGGAGGLGLIVAGEIAGKVKGATLVLTGRSALDDAKKTQLREIENAGARIVYRQMDVTRRTEVEELLHSIGEEFGELNGIIHGAGVIRDNFILKKTGAEFREVLAPKVSGVVNLDLASRGVPLDFFVLFSSVAASFGNPGQSDYSTANAFMDGYAGYRAALAAAGECRGATLSVNWPLWRDGGMHLDEETERMLRQNVGLVPLETAAGIGALYLGLASGHDRVMVMEGELQRIDNLVSGRFAAVRETEALAAPTQTDAASMEEKAGAPSSELLLDKASDYFKKQLSVAIKLPVNRIDLDALLENYGIDSVMVMQLTNQLEKDFGSLSKTLFFEYRSLREVTEYFLGAHRERLTALLGIEPKEVTVAQRSDFTPARETDKAPVASRRRSRFALQKAQSNGEKQAEALDVAIIGVSGRYPMAGNIEEFWRNLRDGRDCISEIPAGRWDHSLYFDKDKNKTGKSYSKWGGFIDGVDEFDPLFFNISPAEAEIMDPQERLFLQCVYETLEDAGYTADALGRQQRLDIEGNVGVYVGVMWDEYQLYGAQETVQGRPIALAGSHASIANRISYFYNFHGPSMAVDTMCSSSLTAIHLACETLQRGGCEIAIAGGVNVSVHPNKYLMLSQWKFASSKGRCESFGEGGDGYVPGEGVGAVLLKPLSRAVADGDHIYGVIKGTSINHGGKTNGYTVPNPNAQAAVIGRVFKDAGVDPRTIGYIEAHGTGTSLGDPIEIAALSKTFRDYTNETQFCAIGSAKSNIGHCESAAGIAGVTKVLLQLKHRQLVPSLHSATLNPHIDFGSTPFVVQQELSEWNRPVLEVNGERREYPRRAGISSFGAGGANAHVLIEEYVTAPDDASAMVSANLPQILILSAKNPERLQETVERLLEFVEEKPALSMTNLAYTLQVGREAMEVRLAMVVGTWDELVQGLNDYLTAVKHGREPESSVCIATGVAGNEPSGVKRLFSGAIGESMKQMLVREHNLEKLATLWVQGNNLDWESLHAGEKVGKMSLPTYPFAKERYWVPTLREEQGKARQSAEMKPEYSIDTKDSTKRPIQDQIQEFITQYLSQELHLPEDQMKFDKDIQDYGANSVTAMKLARRLEERFEFEITGREMMEYRTIRTLSDYLGWKSRDFDAPNKVTDTADGTSDDNHGMTPLEKFRLGILTLDEIENMIEKGDMACF
jgi:acyl transferase domain-containing protein